MKDGSKAVPPGRLFFFSGGGGFGGKRLGQVGSWGDLIRFQTTQRSRQRSLFCSFKSCFFGSLELW